MKTTPTAGLRMYLHPSRKRIRISLEGDLAGGWVRELERCWRALSGPDPADSLFVDVSRLKSADRSGRELLDTMRSQGVIITGLDLDSGLPRRLGWLSRMWSAVTHGQRFHVLSISRSR